MANADYQHDQALVLHPVQDSIVPDPGAPHVIGSAQLDGAAPSGLLRKPIDPSGDPAPNPGVQARQRSRRRWKGVSTA